jgi:hypothetical protein
MFASPSLLALAYFIVLVCVKLIINYHAIWYTDSIMSGIVPSTISLTPARSVSCESSDTLPMPVDDLGTNSDNFSLPQHETRTGSLYLLYWLNQLLNL